MTSAEEGGAVKRLTFLGHGSVGKTYRSPSLNWLPLFPLPSPHLVPFRTPLFTWSQARRTTLPYRVVVDDSWGETRGEGRGV